MTNPNDSAFPIDFDRAISPEFGLTKREAFAMAAMQGILAGPDITCGAVASEAVTFADYLIAALNKEPLK